MPVITRPYDNPVRIKVPIGSRECFGYDEARSGHKMTGTADGISMTFNTKLHQSFRQHWALWLGALIGLIWLGRGLTLGQAPLFDTTEARYGGMAQLMLLTGDWITARMPDDLTPFLGKPPLTFWLIASAMQWLGCNEWAARLPAYLEGTATLWFTFAIARQWVDRRAAWLAVLLLASCPFFWVESGTVAMDTLVMMSVAASLWAIRAIQLAREQVRPWRRLLLELFLALMVLVGLMNKGPISLILFMGPLVLWALANRNWRLLFLPNWPLVLGVGIAASAPWYLACQKANPEFFQYFFIQEHFGRYVLKDYGDRYGSAHNMPYGTAWLYAVAAFAPWSLWLLAGMTRIKTWWRDGHHLSQLKPSTKFLLAWALFAPLFFSVAKSLLIPYLSVSLPPLAILAGRWLSQTLFHLNQSQPRPEEGNSSPAQPLPSSLISLANWPVRLGLVPWVGWLSGATLLGAVGIVAYFCSLVSPLPPVLLIAPMVAMTLVALSLGWLASRVTPARLLGLLLAATLVTSGAMAYWYGAMPEVMGQSRSMRGVVRALTPQYGPMLHSLPLALWGQHHAFSWYFYLRQGWADAMTRHHQSPPPGLGTPKSRSLDPNLPFLVIVRDKDQAEFLAEQPQAVSKQIIRTGRFSVYNLRLPAAIVCPPTPAAPSQ